MQDIEKIYGLHACVSVLNNKQRNIIEVFCTDDTLQKIRDKINNFRYLNNLKVLKRKDLDDRLQTKVHQGIVIFCEKRKINFTNKYLNNQREILILDSLNDSQNVGSIIRSAYLFGIQYIFFNEKNSFSINSTLIKAASGSYENVYLIPLKNIVNFINDLKKNDFWIFGLDNFGEKKITEIESETKKAIILGSENKGIRKLIKEKCDFLVKIPMLKNDSNIDSLNVSNAASILFYELSKK